MPEYSKGGLEAGVEPECCYCGVAGTSTSEYGWATMEWASIEHGKITNYG